jgi:hypothetical protein
VKEESQKETARNEHYWENMYHDLRANYDKDIKLIADLRIKVHELTE